MPILGFLLGSIVVGQICEKVLPNATTRLQAKALVAQFNNGDNDFLENKED